MDDLVGSRLTEQEEQLLMKFADGECRWCGVRFLGRLRARWLIAHKSCAQDFLNSLSLVRNSVGHLISKEEPVSADLWDRIERRIEQEERAVVYLGKQEREFQVALSNELLQNRQGWTQFPKGVFGSIGQPLSYIGPQLLWGVSGAAVGVTASVIGLFVLTGSFPWKNSVSAVSRFPVEEMEVADNRGGQQVGEAFQTVALSGNSSQPVTPFKEPQAVQVEWMRSRGRVHVMNDRAEKSTIFWVRRNIPLPSQSGSSKQGEIRIIDNDGPSAITVRSR